MKKAPLNFGWLLVLPLLAAVWSNACKSGPKHPKELAEVDSLRVEISKTDSLLRTLEKEEVEKVEEEIMSNTQAATAAINQVKDTIDLETATFLTKYRSIAKVLEAYAEGYDKMKGALDTLALNCSNLSHDLRNNTLAEGLDPDQSVEHEKEQAEEVIKQVQFLIPAVRNGLKQNDTLAPKVKAFIMQMNEKLAAKNEQALKH